MVIGMLLTYAGCVRTSTVEVQDGVGMAVEWNKFILKAEVNTEGYRGPVAARAYGYIGLAAYEAARPGLAGEFYTMSRYFPGLKLPYSPVPDRFNTSIALNTCYAYIISNFFQSAPQYIQQEIDDIRHKWEKNLMATEDTMVSRVSKAYGSAVAKAVFEWSATDSLGFRAHHHNYDRSYIAPPGEGKWVTSSDFPMPPLLPYWGNVRPFIITTKDFMAKPLPPYSTQTNQPYYIQALEIISLNRPLSSENQWIAEFWNDDRPGLTFTPAGHWLAIANQVIEKERPSLEKTLETYLKVGIALNDAMIACWYSKYTFNLERPETYIQKHIDKNWRPFSPTPSFPSYPSGHSMMGAAAAEVLTSLYGSTYQLMDKSHEGLKDFVVKPRSFRSFDEMARENALSRILLGVHWRMDSEEGLRLGSLVGKEINQIILERKLTE
jgi:hypothetical protein